MLKISIKEHNLAFETAPSLFSPNQIDKGTLTMLERIAFAPEDKVLDLGCGYGVVGIVAAKHTAPANVFMSDIDKTALKFAAKNAAYNGTEGITIIHSNAYEGINETGFTIIASNPPYHADFSVPKTFIEKGFNRLALGGKFYMVTKRKDWYKNKFIAIFGGVHIHEADGYFVFEAQKRSQKYGKKILTDKTNKRTEKSCPRNNPQSN